MSERIPLLIEIGTEELPPRALRPLMAAFRDELVAELKEARLAPEGVQAYATPRRLAVFIDQLATAQADEQVERLGPKEASARTQDGGWSQAAEGFARSCGVGVEALTVVDTDKGRRLAWRGVQPGQAAVAIIPDAVAAALGRLPIPKRMRWGAGTVEFVRPVHWVVALLGSDVVPGCVMEIPCGRTTYGHRFHGRGREAIELAHAAEYAATLHREGSVIADFDERREQIAAAVAQQAEQLGGEAVLDEALLDEITALVEWPVALTGGFDPRFLAVPEEALISSMQGHQRCLPIRDASGALQPHFIAVANIASRQPEEVRRGNERVIRPRLADAEFFWLQDRRRPLADRLDDLAAVTFHRQLGDLRARSERIAELAARLARQTGAEPITAYRAGLLCKCDLVTEMVGEFPELQGIMGGYYAEADGEEAAVATAIREHYRPAFAGDALPTTQLGQIVSLAERIDTLVGIFATDGPPSADKDPFALRRAAIGLLRGLVEGGHDLDLGELLEFAAGQLPIAVDTAAVVEAVKRFALERLRGYYAEQGFRSELFEAVAAIAPNSPLDFHRRLTAVAAFWQRPEAEHLAAANKRIRNILRRTEMAVSGDPAQPPQGGGSEAAEQQLAGALAACWRQAEPHIAAGEYESALHHLAALHEPVDRFFDEVLVMDEDAEVRRRRLELLDGVRAAFAAVADVSELPTA
ncbi:glycine--tRNA ligase subunit beta [Halorhodospira abdelmalekii]|uniref:glycine--tRNA ligase subunit beta n=1 Tax=Halorhodospira abdelmalekii TaxID=421629 RepID=UPI0019036AB5|nr:glycine--tRNA ligase subunit beta [Halorhodospira abdelmalekii]MBK1733716.1 glycine--tRNA ligase subunit beta [Halorhodospira abdelmalekii]